MANLAIPKRYQFGVSRIKTLDMDTVRAVRNSLDRIAYDREFTKASGAAAKALESAGQLVDDAKQISEALTAMYVVQSNGEIPLDEFTDGVADALEELQDPELRLEPAEKESFKDKLSLLLSTEIFGMISKVGDLVTEGDHVFCHARIVTDIRPVFGSKVELGPLAAVILHNLKISFHPSGKGADRDFYVMLDASDLAKLKEIIIRAEEKSRALRGIMNTEVTLFGESK